MDPDSDPDPDPGSGSFYFRHESGSIPLTSGSGIRILEAQKHVDPVVPDPDSDPDPQHWPHTTPLHSLIYSIYISVT